LGAQGTKPLGVFPAKGHRRVHQVSVAVAMSGGGAGCGTHEGETEVPHVGTTRTFAGSLVRRETPRDGNCMFHAIAAALRGYDGLYCAWLRHRVTTVLELGPLETLTAASLRELAYTAFLCSGKETDAWLEVWQLAYQTPDIRGEFAHARSLAGKSIEALTTEDRLALFDECMKPYAWGDETTLVALETLLQVRVMVLSNRKLQVRSSNYGSDYDPKLFICLQLLCNHYEWVGFRPSPGAPLLTAFSESELPELLITAAHRHCSKATEPFINLKHLSDGGGGGGGSHATDTASSSASTPAAPPPPPVDDPACSRLLEQYFAGRKVREGRPKAAPRTCPVDSDKPRRAGLAASPLICPGRMGPRVFRMECGVKVAAPQPAPTAAVRRSGAGSGSGFFRSRPITPTMTWGVSVPPLS